MFGNLILLKEHIDLSKNEKRLQRLLFIQLFLTSNSDLKEIKEINDNIINYLNVEIVNIIQDRELLEKYIDIPMYKTVKLDQLLLILEFLKNNKTLFTNADDILKYLNTEVVIQNINHETLHNIISPLSKDKDKKLQETLHNFISPLSKDKDKKLQELLGIQKFLSDYKTRFTTFEYDKMDKIVSDELKKVQPPVVQGQPWNTINQT